MTLYVAQLPLLSCCCTKIILRAFYAAVKYFCAALISKKKPAIQRVFLVALYLFLFRRCDFEPGHASVQDLETQVLLEWEAIASDL